MVVNAVLLLYTIILLAPKFGKKMGKALSFWENFLNLKTIRQRIFKRFWIKKKELVGYKVHFWFYRGGVMAPDPVNHKVLKTFQGMT